MVSPPGFFGYPACASRRAKARHAIGSMHRDFVARFVPATLVLFACPVLRGADWPQWRGPLRNGTVTEGTVAGKLRFPPAKAWQSETIPAGPTGGYASPSVAAGRVYVYADHDKQDHVYCLDAKSGQTLWKFFEPVEGEEDLASSTVCVSGGRAYVLGRGGRAYCLDAAKGTEIWRVDFGGGKHSSFLVVEGLAIVMVGGKGLVALDAATSAPAWVQQGFKDWGENSPVPWRSAARLHVIQNTGDKAHCLRASDGQIVWECDGGGYSTPAIENNYMVIVSTNGTMGYKLWPNRADKLWTVEDLRDRGASPIVYRGCAYVWASGQLACIEMSGGQIHWRRLVGTADISSPVIAGGILFANADFGLVTAVRADPQRFQSLGKFNANASPFSSPAVANGRLIVRGLDGVYGYDLAR